MSQPPIVNVAAYKFVEIDNDLIEFRELLRADCINLGLKGTILIAPEGINLMLAGTEEQIENFKIYIKQDPRFTDLEYKTTYSDFVPYHRMLIKVKNEIIAMREPQIDAIHHQGKNMPPKKLKEWLDNDVDFTFLDTRNDYELAFGGFDKAIDFDIRHFRAFPEASRNLSEEVKKKPLVMFCTGGVRCEKAILLYEELGFEEVYQLEGGILNYFKECGGEHYSGSCFVFDDRVALDPNLEVSNLGECKICGTVLPKPEAITEEIISANDCKSCQGYYERHI